MPPHHFFFQRSDAHLQLIGPQWKAVVQGCDTRLTRRYLAIYYYLLIEGSQDRKELKELFFPNSTDNNFRVQLHKLRQNKLIDVQENSISLIKDISSDLDYLSRLQERKDHLAIRDIYREPYPSLRDSLEIQEECNFSDEIYIWIEQQQSQQEREIFHSRLELAQNTSDEGRESQAIKYAEEAYLFLKSLHFDLHCDDDEVTFFTYLAQLEYLLGDMGSQIVADFSSSLQELEIIIPTSYRVSARIKTYKGQNRQEHKKIKPDFNILAINYIKGGHIDDLAHQIILDGYQKIVSGSPEVCLNLSRTCHFVIDKIHHPELRFRVLNLQGLALLHAGQSLKAEYLYRFALTEVTSNEHKTEQYRAVFLSNLCLSLSRQRKHDEAYAFQKEAYAIALQHRNIQTQVIDLSLLARISLQMQHSEDTLEQLQAADQMLSPVDRFSFKDAHFIGHRFLLYAQAYAEQGETERALPYLTQADHIFQNNQEPRGHMFTLITEAKVMFEAKRYHVAWEKFQQAKQYASLLGHTEPFDEAFILDVFGLSPVKLHILANR